MTVMTPGQVLALVLCVAGEQVDSLHVPAEGDRVPTTHVNFCRNVVLAGRADLTRVKLHAHHPARC